MRKILFTLGGLLLSCLCVFSQLKDWGNYTNNDLIRCMLSDGDYLWIGTNGGIVKLEISTLDAVRVGEARFTNGEATVTVDKVPATYLYAVSYPDGRRESGKVMMK